VTSAPDTLAAIKRAFETLRRVNAAWRPAGMEEALDTLTAALARVERREPDYEVFYEWVTDNAPRVVELCPYKFPDRRAFAPEAGSSPFPRPRMVEIDSGRPWPPEAGSS
jgi:hypothetical protein